MTVDFSCRNNRWYVPKNTGALTIYERRILAKRKVPVETVPGSTIQAWKLTKKTLSGIPELGWVITESPSRRSRNMARLIRKSLACAAVDGDGKKHYFYSAQARRDAGYHFCAYCLRQIIGEPSYIEPHSGREHCSYCATNYRCSRCGRISMDIVHISARSRVCRSCAANSLANSPNICSYHTFKQSHQYRFYGSDATPRTQTPFIGFELEVDRDTVHAPYEYNQGCVYDLGDVFNDFCRYERDGSLTRGFEIISHPASLEWLTNNRKMFEDAFDILTNTYRFTSHNNGNCGLHIHVDRTYFENKQDSSLVKLLTLINKFNAEFVKFSRRTQEQLDCYAAMYFDSPESVVLKSKEGSYGRYYALNLSNRDTIEFRLWRGTLKLTTFFATLKFTVRLCELAKEKSSEELLNMTWEELLGDDPDIEAYWASVKQRRA